MTQWPWPKNATDARSFPRLVGYHSRFIQNFSKIATSPTNLTRKATKLRWIDTCEEAFQKLKRILTSAPMLALPTNDKHFMVYSDASKNGLGCVLR